MATTLARRRKGRVLLGVVAGLAAWWDMSPGVLRALYILVSVCSAGFPGILVYIVLAIVMPPED